MNLIAPSNSYKSWRQCRATLTTPDSNCFPCGIRSAAIRVSRRSSTHSRRKIRASKLGAMNPKIFFGELKRRNVYKVAVAYAVVGWLLIQVATQVFPFLEIPNWAIRLVISITALGFPMALIVAWAFELTPEGIKRTEEADAAGQQSKSHAWIYVALVGAAISVALFFLGRCTAPIQRAVAGAAEKSIAILPFENLSRDPDNAYF